VEDAGDENDPASQVGAAQREEQADDRAVTAAEQMCRPADHLLQERDRVQCHRLKRDRTRDIRRAAVPAPLGRVHVEAGSERTDVRSERARIDTGPSGVKQHQRLAVAVLLIPGAHVAELCVVRDLNLPYAMPSCERIRRLT
jgi:hypothetical protein